MFVVGRGPTYNHPASKPFQERSMTESKYLILGGGMVAGYAARQMVESGLRPKELTILSADTAIPYERPRFLKVSSLAKIRKTP
jgi:hypothetical protein